MWFELEEEDEEELNILHTSFQFSGKFIKILKFKIEFLTKVNTFWVVRGSKCFLCWFQEMTIALTPSYFVGLRPVRMATQTEPVGFEVAIVTGHKPTKYEGDNAIVINTQTYNMVS